MAAARGALSEDRYTALLRAQHHNPGLQLLPGNKAKFQLSDGTKLNIANSTTGVKLFWACEGCRDRNQHMRYCTSHALGKPLALRCLICSYDPAEWEAEGRQPPYESEVQLMQQLVGAGVSADWCCQVALPFWPSALDFMHISKKAVMQADGSAHFEGIHDADYRDVLEGDMRCTVAAVERGISMIRVHDLQLQRGAHPYFLSGASLYATSTLCVVLSVAYRTVMFYEDGKWLTYVGVLVSKLRYRRVVEHPWGIVIECGM
jgi:hypothetical protein